MTKETRAERPRPEENSQGPNQAQCSGGPEGAIVHTVAMPSRVFMLPAKPLLSP